MRRKQLLDRINELLTRLVFQQSAYLLQGLTDTSHILEDVILLVFRDVYGYTGLRNLNKERPNFPAVDLGDDCARVGIQVTATRDLSKILDTLKTFVGEHLYERFDRLRIYILTTKQQSYSSARIDGIVQGRFTFSVTEDVLDYRDLLGQICHLEDISAIERVLRILESNVESAGIPSPMPDPSIVLEASTRCATDAVTREKNRKRYLPGVYSEVAETKDKVRCFCYPELFARKVSEDLRRLGVGQVDRYLRMISVAPFQVDISEWDEVRESDNAARCQVVRDTIDKAVAYLLPFCSERRDPPPSLVPEHSHRVYRQIYINLASASGRLVREMEKLNDDLRATQSRIFLIIGRAGQGKTSFLCDLIERSLIPRLSPALLFSGEELDQLGSYNIGRHVVRALWDDERDMRVSDGLSAIESFCATQEVCFLIIIDGLNEVGEYVAFRTELERFIGIALNYPHIRIILTCRSEYFEERFKPLMYASFADEIYRLDDFDQRMSEVHRDTMVRSYLRFFHLLPTTMSGRVHTLLSQDTILLRMFCEAYGNPEDNEDKPLPPLIDINRDEVFGLYLNRKLDELSQRRSARDGTSLGVRAVYQRALAAIVDHMLAERQFSNVPIVGLADDHYPAIQDMLSEDLIVRKDLHVGSVLDTESEAISFTFDEFRDFLLADRLVRVHLPLGTAEFSALVDELVQPYSPIAEGIMRYLFYASRRSRDRELRDTLAAKPWYNEAFLDCIFSVPESCTDDDDIERLKELFHSESVDPSRIVVPLALRWDQRYFQRLNTELLLSISADLSPDAMESRIRRIFGTYRWALVPSNRVNYELGSLVSYASQWISDSTGLPGFEHLMEFLVLLLELPSEDDTHTVSAAFLEYTSAAPGKAFAILSKYVDHSHDGIRRAARAMLEDLVRGTTPIFHAPSKSSLTTRSSLKTGQPLTRVPDEHGFWGHFLLALETRMEKADFLRAARVVPGTYASDLIERLYDCLFVTAVDVQSERHTYYAEEYSDPAQYLYCRYDVPARLLEQVAELSQGAYLGYGDDRTGFLGIPEAMDIVNQILEAGEDCHEDPDGVCHQ